MTATISRKAPLRRAVVKPTLPGTVRHADDSSANPLTGNGLIWVEDAIRDCLTTRKVTAATTDTLNEWADFYKDELDFRRIVLEALENHGRPIIANSDSRDQIDGSTDIGFRLRPFCPSRSRRTNRTDRLARPPTPDELV
jgi:hypothetical protein